MSARSSEVARIVDLRAGRPGDVVIGREEDRVGPALVGLVEQDELLLQLGAADVAVDGVDVDWDIRVGPVNALTAGTLGGSTHTVMRPPESVASSAVPVPSTGFQPLASKQMVTTATALNRLMALLSECASIARRWRQKKTHRTAWRCRRSMSPDGSNLEILGSSMLVLSYQ